VSKEQMGEEFFVLVLISGKGFKTYDNETIAKTQSQGLFFAYVSKLVARAVVDRKQKQETKIKMISKLNSL
jgi:hypothetical protein